HRHRRRDVAECTGRHAAVRHAIAVAAGGRTAEKSQRGPAAPRLDRRRSTSAGVRRPDFTRGWFAFSRRLVARATVGGPPVKAAIHDIPFARPDFDDAEARAVAEVLKSGWASQGPMVARFEELF